MARSASPRLPGCLFCITLVRYSITRLSTMETSSGLHSTVRQPFPGGRFNIVLAQNGWILLDAKTTGSKSQPPLTKSVNHPERAHERCTVYARMRHPDCNLNEKDASPTASTSRLLGQQCSSTGALDFLQPYSRDGGAMLCAR